MSSRSLAVTRASRGGLAFIGLILLVAEVNMARASAPAPDTVRFVIDMRESIEAGRFDTSMQVVSVRGGVDPLSWNEGRVAEDPDGDGLFEAVVAFPPATVDAQVIPYKFKVEGGAMPNDGWEEGANRFFVRIAGDQAVSRAFGEMPPPLQPTFSGDVRVHDLVHSAFVEPRDILVYLPPEYDIEEGRRYPVLYLHDGQNVFDVRAVGAEWRVDETAERLIASGEIEPVIVVGVANTPARIDEYTPTNAQIRADMPEMGGRGDHYGRFLIEELKPMIDAEYRTMRGAAHTALGGSSLGGLISLYLGLRHPDVYGQLLVVSPSIWWDDSFILRHVRSLPKTTSQRIWLDMGTQEGVGLVDQVRSLKDALVEKGWVVNENLCYVEEEGATHNEGAWAARVEDMLRFLYATQTESPASTNCR